MIAIEQCEVFGEVYDRETAALILDTHGISFDACVPTRGVVWRFVTGTLLVAEWRPISGELWVEPDAWRGRARGY